MGTKPTAKAIAAAERLLSLPNVSEEHRAKAESVLRRNDLPRVEPRPLSELDQRRLRRLRGSARGRRRRGDKLPPPSPAGKSVEEIAEMDPASDEFRHHHPNGQLHGLTPESLESREARGFRAVALMDKQNRANARRAKTRKWEAEVVAAKREYEASGKVLNAKTFEVVETQLVAAGALTLDDWSDEELIRGYRKNRNGKFGPPPKWVAQEVVQELHRRILKRGGKKMLQAYLKSIDELVRLANEADSEKVRLDAIRELQNRVAGKVPDRIAVSADDPWQDMLADSYTLPSELPPLEIEGAKRDAPDAPPPGPSMADGTVAGSSSGVEARGVPTPSAERVLGDWGVDG